MVYLDMVPKLCLIKCFLRGLLWLHGVKRCGSCKRVLPLDAFYPDKRTIRRCRCKECVLRREVPKQSARIVARYRVDDEFRRQRIARGIEWRAKNPDYYVKRQANISPAGRREQYARTVRQRAIHPEKSQARLAVHRALRKGVLKRQPCTQCGSTRNVDGHHYRGYEREHWLDVRWLCRKCHAQEHHGDTGARSDV